MSDNRAQPFLVASANFGGAARSLRTTGAEIVDRVREMAEFLDAPAGVSTVDSLPMVAGVQEMCRLVVPSCDVPAAVAGHLRDGGWAVDDYFVPTVTTEWYPLAEKWQGKWSEGIEEMEQGMLTCAKGAALSAPWLAAPWNERFKGRKLDLPVCGTDPGAQGERGQKGDGRRGLFYQGNRDTEPRVATAHGVNLGGDQGSQFLFINVHLATLESERGGTRRMSPDDGEERVLRRSCLEAARVRSLQLAVIREFVLEVAYAGLKLPVIIAGDFNASVDAPELEEFMNAAGLLPVFRPNPAQCWECGLKNPRGEAMVPFFTLPGQTNVLGRTSSEVATWTGDATAEDCRISASECCSRCHTPFFTHKRLFGLIDNVLYTDPDGIPGLKWRLRPGADPSSSGKGISAGSHFSDHFPVWCRFDCEAR